MTPEKREELRRLAEKAHQTSSGQDWLDRILTRWLNGHDEAFIRAANPATVLDLLAEHEEDQGVIAVWRGRTERAEKDRDALKAEVERLREFVSNFAEVAEAAVRHHEWRAAGSPGQHVPFHGDFASLPPSSVATLRKLAQAARRVLTQTGGGD